MGLLLAELLPTDNWVMTDPLLDVEVSPAEPSSAAGRMVLTAYFRDIVGRYHGREANDAEVAAAMSEEPSDDLRPPHGLFFLARRGDTILGCAGLRLLPHRIGELTRLYVMPSARRLGIGERLLQAVENAARAKSATRLRLDTRSDLTEARQFYTRNGYQEVAPFNDGRFADHWYEKTLA